MTEPEKREGCLPGHPQQSPAAKLEIAEINPVRVSAKGKRNLAVFRRACLDGQELVDEIQDGNIPRGEQSLYAENMALLGRVAIRCKRLCRTINAMSREAQRRANQ